MEFFARHSGSRLSPFVLGGIVASLMLISMASRVARAGPPGTVLVITQGDEATRALLYSNAAAALHTTDVGLTTNEDAELAGFDVEGTLRCVASDLACADLLGKAPAKWVLFLGLSQKSGSPDGDKTILAELYSASDGSRLQVEHRVCERCSSDERLAREITELTTGLITSEIAHNATETYLNIRTTPSAAILSIDGTVVGPTGMAYRVSPGEHRIEVRQKGYYTASQTLTIEANEHKALSMSLGTDEPEAAGSSTRAILSWISIGSGIAALGTGIAWTSIDGDSICGNEAHKQVHDTKTIGISSMVAGTLLLGTGVTLLLTSEDDSSDAPKALQIHAGPGQSGAAIEISGQF